MGNVRVRQLETREEFDLPDDESALRVPYSFEEHGGPCVELGDGTVQCSGRTGETLRTRPTTLGACHPGERVLLQFEPPAAQEAGWWLCEVESVDGDDVASS